MGPTPVNYFRTKKIYQEIAQNAFSKPCGSQRVKEHYVAAKWKLKISIFSIWFSWNKYRIRGIFI